ncbi:MAG TPA: SDR family oxidoreductase [Candidatus Binatia bacterium]|nr:SDR family oxidoreductase [Candidatus Binatia bacterium]
MPGSTVDMRGKVCMVTGANSGLGLATVRELAHAGADVVLVCRDRAKADAAIESVRREIPDARLELLLADFASLADVRRLADDFRRSGRPLDVLVNNAGLMLTERRTTADGFEYTFAVNHLAPFLLTSLLREPLAAAEGGRVVNVASRAHTRASLDLDDLNAERGFDGWRAYCRSKLCNVLFNRELARRLGGTRVTANALHPGVIATGFGREATGFWKWLLRAGRFVMSPPEKGAATQVYLATSPAVAGVTGEYFVDCRPVATSRAGADPELARRLWESSERMVGPAA